jgi:uroporphyrinogen-III decarboxylase
MDDGTRATHSRADFQDDFAVATEEDARYWEKESHRLDEETEYAVVGMLGGAGFGDVACLPGPFVKRPRGIRRMDDWLAAHLLFPDYMDEVFSLQTEVMLKNLELYRQAVGERIQIVWMSGTDFGTQHGTFLSPEVFRRAHSPIISRSTIGCTRTRLEDLLPLLRRGVPLMKDFVEMGVDILNPLQLSADGMDPVKIKEEFGGKLAFWGGGVDTQRTLPFGTPDEVRREVRERIKILSPGGGYVFNPIHNVVANVPPENLIAMYQAARSWR